MFSVIKHTFNGCQVSQPFAQQVLDLDCSVFVHKHSPSVSRAMCHKPILKLLFAKIKMIYTEYMYICKQGRIPCTVSDQIPESVFKFKICR